MGCGSCGKDGLPKGCKNNGSCGVQGCEKLSVFDWLSDMELPAQGQKFDCVEVRFKNGRKEYCRNVHGLKLHMGDVIAVETQSGHDIGSVSLTGELVRLQMKKRRIRPESSAVRKVFRKANQHDIDVWQKAQQREKPTMIRTRQIAEKLQLDMKISDVEYQGDNTKAIFYYIADQRVDFRELIKLLASEFRIRVEMKQIGSRQEAGKIGGIGSCGRELCCSTWLTDFRSVSTSAARYQQLSLNPQKLAGQCGKLKCCLNFELDSYLDGLEKFPSTKKNLLTQKGEAVFQKLDIFKELMWYGYKNSGDNWVALSIEEVRKIMKSNEEGEKPESLELFTQPELKKDTSFESVVGQDELTRFDKPRGKKTKRRKPRKNGPRQNSKNNPKKK